MNILSLIFWPLVLIFPMTPRALVCTDSLCTEQNINIMKQKSIKAKMFLTQVKKISVA